MIRSLRPRKIYREVRIHLLLSKTSVIVTFTSQWLGHSRVTVDTEYREYKLNVYVAELNITSIFSPKADHIPGVALGENLDFQMRSKGVCHVMRSKRVCHVMRSKQLWLTGSSVTVELTTS